MVLHLRKGKRMSIDTNTKVTEFVSEKAAEAVERAAKAKWTETLDAWQIRPNIDDVIANWTAKVPTVHDYDGKCFKQGEGLVERKSSHWLGQAFDANRELGRLQKPRTYGFCTRCVIEKTEEAKEAARKERALTKLSPQPATESVDPTFGAGPAIAEGERMARKLAQAREEIDAENAAKLADIELVPTPGRQLGERLNGEAAELAATTEPADMNDLTNDEDNDLRKVQTAERAKTGRQLSQSPAAIRARAKRAAKNEK